MGLLFISWEENERESSESVCLEHHHVLDHLPDPRPRRREVPGGLQTSSLQVFR